MVQKVAIVTTLRGAGASLDSFIRYHAHVGFAHFYLFFDDPLDQDAERARAYPNTTVMLHDASLRRLWQETRIYKQRRFKSADRPLMDRQQLNVAVAISLAVDCGFDWLLHIDQDELFYARDLFRSPGKTLDRLFQGYCDAGIYNVNFRNFEAVPEHASVTDPFLVPTLFKRHPAVLPGGRFSPEQVSLIRSVSQFPERYYFNYANGKSAARLSRELIPDGVHDFFLREQQGWLPHWQRRLADNRFARRFSVRWPVLAALADRFVATQLRRRAEVNEPLILHYYNCGFDQFWAKYRHFEYYERFDNRAILDRLSRFHAEASEIARTGDVALARQFYERRVVLSDPQLIDRLITANILCRVSEPADCLAWELRGVVNRDAADG